MMKDTKDALLKLKTNNLFLGGINMENVFIMDHPLIQHKVGRLRSKDTGSKEFRELVREIAQLMCYEATRNLPLEEVEIETPIQKTKANVISGKTLAFVPILRAGTGMLDGVLSLVPSAYVIRVILSFSSYSYVVVLPFPSVSDVTLSL